MTAPSTPSSERRRAFSGRSAEYAALVAVLIVLATASGLACWWFVSQHGHTHAAPLSFGALVSYVVMWSLMMAAMMLPTVHRTTALYVRAVRRETPSRWVLRLCSLLAGYLFVWSAIGIPVYLVESVLRRTVPASSSIGIWVTAVLIAAAGLFQFSRLKERCLHHCQSPLAFVAEYLARTGRGRDFRAGLRHGVTCLGCCAAMVVVLIAVGTMSVPAMVVLGTLAMIEKTWARGPLFSRVAGVGMILYAILVLVGPQWAPTPFGAPLPHSPGATVHHH